MLRTNIDQAGRLCNPHHPPPEAHGVLAVLHGQQLHGELRMNWWWVMLDAHWLAILFLSGLVIALNGLALWHLAGQADAQIAATGTEGTGGS
jgi:hypothetical protein